MSVPSLFGCLFCRRLHPREPIEFQLAMIQQAYKYRLQESKVFGQELEIAPNCHWLGRWFLGFITAVLKNQRTSFWPVLVVLKILNKSNIYKNTGSFMKTIGALTCSLMHFFLVLFCFVFLPPPPKKSWKWQFSDSEILEKLEPLVINRTKYLLNVAISKVDHWVFYTKFSY